MDADLLEQLGESEAGGGLRYSSPSLNAADNDEKAGTGMYEDPIRDRSGFSAVIGSVSQPGELALSTEEITAEVLGGEKLEPPGVS